MNLPDFRAAERTFQLLEQVAGRAGRGDRPGRVIIQTYAPDHPSIVAAATHDYEGFARDELAAREETGYPPFSRMIALRHRRARRRAQARAAATAAADAARARRAPRVTRARPGRGAAGDAARPRALAGLAVVARSRRRRARPRAPRPSQSAATGDLRFAVDVDPHSTL